MSVWCYSDPRELYGMWPPRRSDSHKGSYGRVLIVGGSCGMGGAALLAGSAAYRMGCGLVELMSDECNRLLLQIALPEAVFSAYNEVSSVRPAVERATAVAVGPGLGQSPLAYQVLEAVLDAVAQMDKPLVADADALNMLAASARTRPYPKRCVITPHPGEMARLLQTTAAEMKQAAPEVAAEYAGRHHVVTLLKGAGTQVASPDGRSYCNRSGCSGMATGGSGDVLSGMIASLMAQGMDVFEAACLGAYLHGCCGEAASGKLGERSMLASDLVRALPEVLAEVP